MPARKSEVEGRCGKQSDGCAKTREAKLAVVWSADTTDKEGRPVRDPDSATYNAAIETIATRGTRARTVRPAHPARGRAPSADTTDKEGRPVRDPDSATYNAAIETIATRGTRARTVRPAHPARGRAPRLPHRTPSSRPRRRCALDLELRRRTLPRRRPDCRHLPRQGHLFEVAKAIYGPGSEVGERWAKQRREELDAGRVDDVIGALRSHAESCEEARRDVEYFSNNRERMSYPTFRAMGLCVATGVVEGGCKHIIGTRLKRGGVRWTVAGANAIIALRCAVESHRFDDFWERRASATA